MPQSLSRYILLPSLLLVLLASSSAFGQEDDEQVRLLLGQGWTFMEHGNLAQAEKAFTEAFERPAGANSAETYYALAAVWWERRNAMAAYMWLTDATSAAKKSYVWNGGQDREWDRRIAARRKFIEGNFTVIKLRSPTRGKPLPPLSDPPPTDPTLAAFSSLLSEVVAEGIAAKAAVQWVMIPNGTYWLGDNLVSLDSGELDAADAKTWDLLPARGKAQKTYSKRVAELAAGRSPARAAADQQASEALAREEQRRIIEAEALAAAELREREAEEQRLELERVRLETETKLEEERIAAQEQARLDSARRERDRADAERLAKEEAERLAIEEAERAEREALAAQRRADEEAESVAEEAKRVAAEARQAARRAEETRKAEERRAAEQAEELARRAEKEARAAGTRAEEERTARLAEEEAAERAASAEREALQQREERRTEAQRSEAERLAEAEKKAEDERRAVAEREAGQAARDEERQRLREERIAARVKKAGSEPPLAGAEFADRRFYLAGSVGPALVEQTLAEGTLARAEWSASAEFGGIIPIRGSKVSVAVGISYGNLPASGCSAVQTRTSVLALHGAVRVPVQISNRLWFAFRGGMHVGAGGSWPTAQTRARCGEAKLGADDLLYGVRVEGANGSGRLSYSALDWSGYSFAIGPDLDATVFFQPPSGRTFIGVGFFLRHDQLLAAIRPDSYHYELDGSSSVGLETVQMNYLDPQAAMARLQLGFRLTLAL